MLQRGLATSRERAQALIMAARVLVDEQKVEKPGAQVAHTAALRVLGDDLRYVSRGGLKLEAALQQWQISLRERICMDVGASTGGFTDCMLQAGAARVFAVDTGYGQIAHTLRVDPRVHLLERTNARYLQATETPQDISFIAMDVSFISATLVLPAVLGAAFGGRAAGPSRELVVLVKPQFEVGREHIGKGGIVRDSEAHAAAVARVRAAVHQLGSAQIDTMPSPILGTEGNREFLLHAVFVSAGQ